MKVLLSMAIMSLLFGIAQVTALGDPSVAATTSSSRSLDGDELLRIGDLHEVQRHWQEALPYYQRALSAYREKRMRRGEGQALLKISHVLERQGRLEEAFAAADEGLRAVPPARDGSLRAQILLQRGEIAEALERWADAMTSYREAGRSSEEGRGRPDKEGRQIKQIRIDALIREGLLGIRQDQVRESLDLLQRAYREARQHSFPAEQMRALQGMGEAQVRLEEHEAAQRSFEEGLALARQLQEMKQEALFSLWLAHLHRSTGHYAAGRDMAQQALTRYQSVRDRLGEGDVLSFLGTLYLDEGDLEKATAHHQRALELYRALRHRAREAGSLINLGIVQESHGLFSQAYDLYNKALFILHDASDTPFTPVSSF